LEGPAESLTHPPLALAHDAIARQTVKRSGILGSAASGGGKADIAARYPLRGHLLPFGGMAENCQY